MIGRYKVVTELGRSDSSVVYLATDRLTGARVAQRVVTGPVSAANLTGETDGGADGEPARLWLTRRLCRLALLHHPNLVEILDYGFDPERRPYYVQRLLEDHRGLLAAGRGQPFESRVEYLLHILQGLTYLHHRGVVHGDLRPETVLVHGSRVRLVNFGLAAHDTGASAYLAPEILRGAPASAAADLYAVGVLAWELFTGRDADGGSARLEMSTREIDGRLIPVLGQLLEVDRNRRLRDAALAIRDLCAALDRPPPEETAAIRRSFLEAGRLIDRRREMERLRALLAALVKGRGGALLVAGALWLPTGVDTGRTRAERERFGRIASRSWERFSALEGREYGVRRLSVFDALSGPSRREQVTRHVPTTLKEWPRLPVRGTSCGGFEYTTLLVEPPVYMPALLRDVLAHGARVEQRTFADADDVRSLDEPVVVNCMGLGAGEVFADDAVLPVRGQLVHLHPEPLDYALSFHTSYMFPRGDAVVLGGTFEDGVAVAEADPRDCAAILRRHRDFFGAV